MWAFYRLRENRKATKELCLAVFILYVFHNCNIFATKVLTFVAEVVQYYCNINVTSRKIFQSPRSYGRKEGKKMSMSDKVKFIRLHDADHDKVCLLNIFSVDLISYDWDEDSTVIEFSDGSHFTVRESVEEIESIIARVKYYQ